MLFSTSHVLEWKSVVKNCRWLSSFARRQNKKGYCSWKVASSIWPCIVPYIGSNPFKVSPITRLYRLRMLALLKIPHHLWYFFIRVSVFDTCKEIRKRKSLSKLRKEILKAKIDTNFSPHQHCLQKTQKSKSGQDPENFEKLQRLRAVCVAFLDCDSQRAAYRRSLDAGRMPHGWTAHQIVGGAGCRVCVPRVFHPQPLPLQFNLLDSRLMVHPHATPQVRWKNVRVVNTYSTKP